MGALEGIRVLDCGQYLAGPLVAMMLADQGADVIRIDPPGGPLWSHPANAILQRGKRSLVLDLKSPADAAEALRLAQNADILIENFRPGVMARLGLGVEALLARHPRLIYCSLPGFASDDPRAKCSRIRGSDRGGGRLVSTAAVAAPLQRASGGRADLLGASSGIDLRRFRCSAFHRGGPDRATSLQGAGNASRCRCSIQLFGFQPIGCASGTVSLDSLRTSPTMCGA